MYLILSLPAYMFGPPIYAVKQSVASTDDSDDSNDDESNEFGGVDYTVFVSHLVCVLKNADKQITTSRLSGSQLRPLVDKSGRFFIGKLLQFFPTLDTIFIMYTKTLATDEEQDQSEQQHIKLIDVNRRFDIRNNTSCRMGVVF